MSEFLKKNWLTIAVAIGVGVWMLWSHRTPVYQPQPGPVQYVEVPKVITKIREVTIPGPERIVLIPGAADALKMPELGKDNVLAVGSVPPHTGKTTIVAVGEIDNNALRVTLKSRQEPPPFLELKRDLRVGAYIGTGQSFRGSLTFTPLRIGPVDVAVMGDYQWIDSRSEVRAWLGAEMRF